MQIIERNLQEIGKSLFVSLPKEWTKLLKLKKGSKIKMMTAENGILTIAPEFTKQDKNKESEIEYDKQFKRKFYKEYFEGNDKITITIKEGANKKDIQELYSFLKKFMNVQIIEENKGKIVVKSFKIEDLSIEECLKRMYFLSTSMIEESLEGNTSSVKEMRDSTTRFYYMIVMQIRRFLEEGKYTEENQIPLIRAMDLRMAAEKIQRVSEIATDFEKINNKEISKFAELVREYYSKSILCLINSNYEKALALWSEEKELKEKYSKFEKKKDKTTEGLFQIVRYSKEISMLVR
ncbi:MAG: hypothetical protein WCI72_01310 [archaeon]